MSFVDVSVCLWVVRLTPCPTNPTKPTKTACASYRQFARIIPPLAKRFRVVAFDAFGCGQSPKPKGHWDAFATEELFADLLEIYRRYKV